MKYPFLYPRNRWTGNHYDNWKFERILYGHKYVFKSQYGETPCEEKGWYQKAFIINFNENECKTTVEIKNLWYALLFYVGKFIYNYPMQWIHCIPTYTEWDAMDDMPGWKKAFGDQMLKEIKTQLKKDKCLYSWRITDLKEKYGSLRLYSNFASVELQNIINKYDDLSYETCIRCGEPAKIITDGYVLPYCEHCWANMEHPHKIGMYKIDGKKWVDADQIIVSDKKLGDK